MTAACSITAAVVLDPFTRMKCCNIRTMREVEGSFFGLGSFHGVWPSHVASVAYLLAAGLPASISRNMMCDFGVMLEPNIFECDSLERSGGSFLLRCLRRDLNTCLPYCGRYNHSNLFVCKKCDIIWLLAECGVNVFE